MNSPLLTLITIGSTTSLFLITGFAASLYQVANSSAPCPPLQMGLTGFANNTTDTSVTVCTFMPNGIKVLLLTPIFTGCMGKNHYVHVYMHTCYC